MAARLLLVVLIGLAVQRPSRAQTCTGDCGDDGRVTVNELVQAVNIALDRSTIESCVNVDRDLNQRVSIDELVVAANNLVHGCAGAIPSPTVTPTPSSMVSPTPIGDDQLPPTMSTALVAWLEAGRYRTWAAEGQHPGSGPHFGSVRTFVNNVLFASLDAGDATRPVGAAAVKELFGQSGSTVRGWSVSVKVQSDRGGNGWYWLEYYNGNVLSSGVGNTGCTGCHGGGTDYVCTPYPLQPGGQTLPAQCP